MHNFDRGIIKWLPFDALTGYKNAIYKLKEKRNKVDKKELSEDQIEELNRKLEEILNNKKEVTMYYYFKGNIYYLVGVIEKVDYLYKRIRISNRWLSATEIIDIVC